MVDRLVSHQRTFSVDYDASEMLDAWAQINNAITNVTVLVNDTNLYMNTPCHLMKSSSSKMKKSNRSHSRVTAVLSIVEQSPSMPRRVKFHSRIGAGDILLVAVGLVPVITEKVDSGISIL